MSKKTNPILTVATIAALGIMLVTNAVEGANRSGPVSSSAPVSVSSTKTIPGPQGPKGNPGQQGLAGAQGGTGSAGKDGLAVNGTDGTNGTDGISGVGIQAITCNADGTWGFTMTDGTTQTVTGPCSATNGTDGAPGPAGAAVAGWTYRDNYGFLYSCVPASYSTPSSPQYTCSQ